MNMTIFKYITLFSLDSFYSEQHAQQIISSILPPTTENFLCSPEGKPQYFKT